MTAADAEAGRQARVLVTVPCLDLPGGVANYYRTIRPLLDSRKVYFEIGSRPGDRGPVAALLRLLRDYGAFWRELAPDRYDLVHINPSLGSRSVLRDGLFLLLARLRGLPVLVYFRGWEPACEAAIRARFRAPFRFAYGRATAFVVLAGSFAQSLRELGITAPVETGTTLVDDRAFDREAAAPAAGHACRFLFLARLDRDKGLAEAVRAFALHRGRHPGSELTVAGEGPERGPAEAFVAGQGVGGVRFVGHLDDEARARAYAEADVFLFPTAFGEGMPNAVLEAMAHGLPVITRPVGGLRDFFADGRMGLLTESRDPAALAGLLDALAADPVRRRSMGDYNRTYAREHFAASVVAARLLETYGRHARHRRAG